jgi:hypothetical protein
MPVPSSIDELSLTAGNNYPTGSESPTTADEYLRFHASCIAGLRDARVPVGGICMYDGLVADLAPNWKVCDGTFGTPDLRDKFIVGSGSTYALGATGGSKDATLVSHSHAVTGTAVAVGDHSHAVSDPGHAHGANFYRSDRGGGNNGGGAQVFGLSSTDAAATGIGIVGGGAHSHTLSGTATATGSSATNANLPPYYALIYIKRIS